VIWPPPAGTVKIPRVEPTTMVRPSGLHAAPRVSPAEPLTNPGTRPSVWIGPPPTSTVFNALAAKKPTVRLSGDQNGNSAFEVLSIGRASSASNARIHRTGRPATPSRGATYAR